MKAIDTHCHLSHTLKRGLKLSVLLEHAKQNNVVAMIDSPVDVKGYPQTIRMHRTHPKVIYAALGAAPANYHEMDIDATISSIRDYAESKEIVAVGEVGLDYYWIKNSDLREKQHEIFQRFISLANELNLPLIIHSREAEEEALTDLLRAEVPVIMHSFSGSVATALECIDRGYFISIPTAVALRKKNRRIAKAIPLEQTITETDSPYLSPFPDRKRNEPSNVIYAVKEIAKLKEMSEEEVGRITYNNAVKLFKLNL